MSDLLITWDPTTYEGDLVLDGFDLATDEGLASAVFVSIFTWRRANPDDDVTDGDLKGWFGDSYAETEGDQIGSRIWLFLREKITTANLLKLREVIRESLQWLIDDGIASNLEVEVFRNPDHSIHTVEADVTIYRSNGGQVNLRFEDLWRGITA